MRVRLLLTPRGNWIVQSKLWFEFCWQPEELFVGDNAYERAKDYALRLKHQQIEEIT